MAVVERDGSRRSSNVHGHGSPLGAWTAAVRRLDAGASCGSPRPAMPSDAAGGSLAGNDSADASSCESPAKVGQRRLQRHHELPLRLVRGGRGPAGEPVRRARHDGRQVELHRLVVNRGRQPGRATCPAPSRTSRPGRPTPAGGRCSAGSAASRRRSGTSCTSTRTRATCCRSSPGSRARRRHARAVELDELADDAVAAQGLGHGEHQVRCGRALRQRAGQLACRPRRARASRSAGRASPPPPRSRQHPSRARRAR